MKQRKTLTLSQEIYFIGNALSSNSRHVFYEGIINHFLGGTALPNTQELSDDLRVAYACVLPQIRAMQSKYENGSIQKNHIGQTKATLCPSDRSENKRTEANGSESHINIYPFPKLINILNKYISTTNQSPAHARGESTKQNSGAPAEAVLTKLQSSNQELYIFLYKILEKIEESEMIKISGAPVSNKKVMQAVLKHFNNPDIETVLKHAQEEARTHNANDEHKYAISVLYNLALQQQKKQQPATEPGFTQREYNQEFFDGLFDTLDDIEIEEGDQ